MAKAGSKRQAAIDTINANLDAKANDVVEMIRTAADLKSWSEARAYFTYLIEKGFTGAFTGAPLERPVKAKAASRAAARTAPRPTATKPRVITQEIKTKAAHFIAWRQAKAA